MIAMGIVVGANYAGQVIYTSHLYGLHFSWVGGLLLGATLAWFVGGLILAAQGRSASFWVLFAYFLVVFLFYFQNEILLIPSGYGVPYHLFHMSDPVLWWVFLIGDLNLVAAAAFVAWLLALWLLPAHAVGPR